MKHFPSVFAVAVFVFLIGVYVPAKADRIDQLGEGRVPTALCVEAAGIFDQGVWARNIGIARAIVQAPANRPATISSVDDIDKNAMWHPDWDSLTDQERTFFQAHVFEGWDKADEMIREAVKGAAALPDNDGYSIEAAISPQARAGLAQGYFEKCMEVETANRTFHKTASSEAIGGGAPIGANQVCDDLKFDMTVIGRAISDGEPREHLYARASASKKLGASRLKEVLEMIDEAYAWDGPFVEWMEKRYGGCKGI